MFDDISCKVLDSDFGLIMPDYSDAEVDHILRNIYGFESTNNNPHLDPFKVDFNEKDRICQKEKVIRKPKVEQEEKENEDDEDYLFNNYGQAVNFDVKPVVKSKKRGRKY